ncbi:DNA glycosylase [Astrocystis sublimbata]|nr:DNA glycosylase [Astrocystis sublimbata]
MSEGEEEENENGIEKAPKSKAKAKAKAKASTKDAAKATPKSRAKRGISDVDADSAPPAATEVRRSKRVRKSDQVDVKQEDDTQDAQQSTPQKPQRRGKEKRVAKTNADDDVKLEVKSEEDGPPASSPAIKGEEDATDLDNDNDTKPNPKKKAASSPTDLRAKKLKTFTQFAAARQSPFPNFPRPLPAECVRAHQILTSLHGPRTRPPSLTAPSSRAGCGDSPSVLDALVRTILSQNTSNANSSRAKLAMDTAYASSDAWSAIVSGGQEKLRDVISSGGLAVVKSRVITNLLVETHTRYGTYSLDHLFTASDSEAMEELLSFKGVGPKTASCVLLFCLRRDNFAVDTHVYRITGLLGWRPVDGVCSRDQTHAHLDARIPDAEKYGLHILLVTHGRVCEECRAGGKSAGKCELRRAFGSRVVGGEVEIEGEEMKIKTQEEEEG